MAAQLTPVRQPRRPAPAHPWARASWLLLLFCARCNHVLRLLQPGLTADFVVAHDAALLGTVCRTCFSAARCQLSPRVAHFLCAYGRGRACSFAWGLRRRVAASGHRSSCLLVSQRRARLPFGGSDSPFPFVIALAGAAASTPLATTAQRAPGLGCCGCPLSPLPAARRHAGHVDGAALREARRGKEHLASGRC